MAHAHYPLIPAQAGTQAALESCARRFKDPLGPRLRGDERKGDSI